MNMRVAEAAKSNWVWKETEKKSCTIRNKLEVVWAGWGVGGHMGSGGYGMWKKLPAHITHIIPIQSNYINSYAFRLSLI